MGVGPGTFKKCRRGGGLTEGVDKPLPEMHTERIEIEGERYLIYYTFDLTTQETFDPPTIEVP